MVTIIILIGSILLFSPVYLMGQDRQNESAVTYHYLFGHDIQLTAENAFVLVREHHRVQTGSAAREQTWQGWKYRLHGELGVLRRAVFHATVIPTSGDGLGLLKLGVGMRFSAPWAQGIAHPYYGFISTISTQYTTLKTKDEQGGALFVEGLGIAVERKQWKLAKYLTLDAGGSFLPWVRLQTEREGERRTVLETPYLSFAVGVGVELHQYATLVFNAEEIAPLRQLDEKFALSFLSITIRTLL